MSPAEKPRRNQQQRVGSTRSALMAAARQLFAEHGYTAVPADEIVTAAGLSRGALYHHYAGKQDLFLAVFDELESSMATEVEAAVAEAPDLSTAIARSLSCFLDLCERPEVIRIVLTDAPAVLGWQTWREVEARHGLGLITAMVQSAADDGRVTTTSVPVLAQLVLSTLIEAALVIAHATDRVTARAETEAALHTLLSALIPPT